MSARDTRYQFHRQERYTGARQVGDLLRGRQRLAEANERLAGPKQFQVVAAGLRIRSERAHLGDDSGLREHVGAAGHLSAASYVLIVRVSGLHARRSFDDDASA